MGEGATNFKSLELVVVVLFCGVFDPGVELGVQGPPAGVGGLNEPGVDGLVIDIGEAIALSTDRNLFGGGPAAEHELESGSSCLTSCLMDGTGFHDALESIVTSSMSVFMSVCII